MSPLFLFSTSRILYSDVDPEIEEDFKSSTMIFVCVCVFSPPRLSFIRHVRSQVPAPDHVREEVKSMLVAGRNISSTARANG